MINPDIAELNFVEFHYRLSTIYLLYGAVQWKQNCTLPLPDLPIIALSHPTALLLRSRPTMPWGLASLHALSVAPAAAGHGALPSCFQVSGLISSREHSGPYPNLLQEVSGIPYNLTVSMNMPVRVVDCCFIKTEGDTNTTLAVVPLAPVRSLVGVSIEKCCLCTVCYCGNMPFLPLKLLYKVSVTWL